MKNMFSNIKKSILNIDAYLIVFIDGRLSKKYSTINKLYGIEIIYLKNIILNNIKYKIKQGFIKLNRFKGLILYIKSNIKIKKPIYFLYISNKKIYIKKNNLKILIYIEKNINIKIIEHYINKNNIKNINNIFIEININNNTKIDFYKLEELNILDIHMSNMIVNQKKFSKYYFYNINLFCYLLYNKLIINLNKKYSKCILLGLFYPKYKNFIKNNIIINHNYNFTSSNIDFKGIIDNNAKGIFNCYIMIRNNIKNVYGIQKNNNILLSNNSIIKTNPKLKIKSKDVFCTHSTVTGKINKDYIFYLRTRGIKKEIAKNLILLSIINQFFKKIKNISLKKYFFLKIIKNISKKINSFKDKYML
ncbi:SufD family Fe-S cluster assembly protein [Candidatus Portiera aleyrodidarum]|uniref:SufD family Fe-S cluster assembly protein n=1 Tax=Candidatus Portiera aleyrodidarum TaxID=91844 RepID=UPI0021588101|nr:SufD family Fe-S cluster assembly protein [Candidatus Portiera aleyrodidarum]